MLSRSDGEVTVVSARNFFEFIDEATTRHSRIALSERASHNHDPALWSGTETYNDAVRLADVGWEEGLSKLNRIANVSFDKLSEVVTKPVVQYSDVAPGVDYDIVRVLNGEPEHWVYITEPQARGQSLGPVRLVANCTVSSNVSPEIIEAKGGAIAALTMLLEFSGRPVELVCAYGITQFPDPRERFCGKRVEFYVTIKKPDQYLNPMVLSFALAHPAMSRRFLMSHLEGMEELHEDFCIPGHYGYPSEVSHVGDLYIFSGIGFPGMISNWSNSEEVQAWIMWTLQQQGIAMNVEKISTH